MDLSIVHVYQRVLPIEQMNLGPRVTSVTSLRSSRMSSGLLEDGLQLWIVLKIVQFARFSELGSLHSSAAGLDPAPVDPAGGRRN